MEDAFENNIKDLWAKQANSCCFMFCSAVLSYLLRDDFAKKQDGDDIVETKEKLKDRKK